MNLAPNLDQFEISNLETVPVGSHPNSEVTLHVDIEPSRITQRFLVGLLDRNTGKGIAVAIYPATGEVSDLNDGGSVIDYLSLAPLVPGEAVPCELRVIRFGKNFVCNVKINGETFLYPAFSVDGDACLTALVGRECFGETRELRYSGVLLNVADPEPAAA